MDIVTSYYELTEWVKAATGMPAPMLHIHAGMAIYLVGQFLLGSRRAQWLALSIVVEVEVFNEVMNYLYYGSWRWADTSMDVVLTLFWPSMCLLASKYRRWRWARIERRRLAIRATFAPTN